MKPKYLERTKVHVSLILASLCYVGLALMWWSCGPGETYPLNTISITLLAFSACSLFGMMPGDFDDTSSGKIWAQVVFALIPLVGLIVLMAPWQAFR
jgi:hypothetical protein